jgi:hypothetical protein
VSEGGQSPPPSLRIALLLFTALVLTLFGAAALVGFAGRWGCPSQAELERARSTQEVVTAFADRGVTLVPTQLPRGVLGDDKAYRRAAKYRHVTRQAALFVLVCEARCVAAPRVLANEIPVAGRRRQRLRQFSTLGNNIAVLVTDNDGHSGRRLHARVQLALSGLDATEDSDSRCYIG